MAVLDAQTGSVSAVPTVSLSSLEGSLSRLEVSSVAATLALLPEHDQLLLAMLYVEGLSLPETALVLDMTLADVLSQHAVAVTMLRGLMRPRCA